MTSTTASQLIKLIRMKNQLTLEKLARRLDVTLLTVHNWESGRSAPQLSNSAKLRERFPNEWSEVAEEV